MMSNEKKMEDKKIYWIKNRFHELARGRGIF